MDLILKYCNQCALRCNEHSKYFLFKILNALNRFKRESLILVMNDIPTRSIVDYQYGLKRCA